MHRDDTYNFRIVVTSESQAEEWDRGERHIQKLYIFIASFL